MVTNADCQCQRWPQSCTAPHTGTRGLCSACMPGNCERPVSVTPGDTIPPHRAAGSGAQLRRGAVLGAPSTGPRDHVF